MRTALYFPHTEVRSKRVVHDALLLWDNLEVITPDPLYRPYYGDAEIAEAMEIIGDTRVPTNNEKQTVHAMVEDLIKSGVPETFLYSPNSERLEETYPIWPAKFLYETWQLLLENGLTDRQLVNQDYPMSQAAGLSLMAILADVLAGETRARITDRGLAYATIANAPKSAGAAGDIIQVVPLTLKGISADRIPFDRLLQFRKREAREGGADYRRLRSNYREAIEKHIERISNVALGSPDRLELDRAFQSDMEDDLYDLKRELGFAKRDTLLSKDVIALAVAGVTLLAAAGAAHFQMPEVLTGSGAAVLLGGGLSTSNKLGKARYETLRKHPMAYLYEVGLQAH